jgi:hypothetical protein
MADKDKTYENKVRLQEAMVSGRAGRPNSDRIDLDTYVPGFEDGRVVSKEDALKGFREAENELKRESSRGGKAAARDTSLRGKFRELTGYKKGGKVSSASSRADGIAQRGKTKGRMV